MYTCREHAKALVWAKKMMAINFLGGKCGCCGCSDIFVLEFHHQYEKNYNISRMWSYKNSKIQEELKKCKLMCRNCHAELHYPNIKFSKVKLLEMKGKKKCFKCNYTPKSYSSLDFHHIDSKDKKFSFRTIFLSKKSILDKIEMKKIVDELEKCDILCKNCHVKKQVNMKLFNKIKPLINFKINNHIEHASPQPNRAQEMEIKGSNYRNSLAKWLWEWRKRKSVKKTAEYFSIKPNMLSSNLLYSRVYREIREKISKPTSQYKGVYWDSTRKKWSASIKKAGKSKNLGRFNNEEDAYKAFVGQKK